MSSFDEMYADDPEVQRLVERVIDAGQRLPKELRGEIVESNRRVGEALVAMALDIGLASVDAPGGGWAPIHAVRLLGERRQLEAVEALVEIAATTEPDDLLHGAAIFALQKIGAPALGPILAVVDEEPELASRLAEVLATLEIRDGRIIDVLEAVVADDPQLGASYVATYGDPAAIDVLRDALEEVDAVDDADLAAHQTIIDLAVAIESLGGTLSAGQVERVRQAYAARERSAEALIEAAMDVDSSGEDDDQKRPASGSRGSRR